MLSIIISSITINTFMLMILKDILKCKSHLQKVYLLIIILHQFINILTYLQNRCQKYQNGKVSFNSFQQKIERKCLPSPSGKRSQHLPNPPVVRQNKPYLPTWKGEMTPWKLHRIFIFRSKFANWESCQASALERLAKNSSLLKAVNYFRKKFHHRCFAESASLILAVSTCLRFGVSFTDQKKWNLDIKAVFQPKVLNSLRTRSLFLEELFYGVLFIRNFNYPKTLRNLCHLFIVDLEVCNIRTIESHLANSCYQTVNNNMKKRLVLEWRSVTLIKLHIT